MEKLKDPAMLLSLANSIGLVGSTAYFYKQLEAVRADMVKISQTLTGVLRKLSEMEKGEQQKGEALHTLNDQIKHINQQVSDLPSFEFADNVEFDLDEIVAALSDHDIHVERAAPVQRGYGQPRRSGDRRGPARRALSDPELDDRRDTRRSVRSQSRQPAREPVREPVRESTRDTPRETARVQVARSEPSSGYDDDTDLIGEVRRQQQTRN